MSPRRLARAALPALLVLAGSLGAGCAGPSRSAPMSRMHDGSCSRWVVDSSPGAESIDLLGETFAGAPGAAGAAPDDDFRQSMPAPGPERPYVVPRIEEIKLSSGVRVLFVENHRLPVVTARVGIDRGAADTRPGAAAFFSRAWASSTECRGPSAIYAVARTLGADLVTDADYDSTMIGVRVFTPGFESALDLLADLALHPDFDRRSIDPIRTGLLTALAERDDQPRAVLSDTIGRSLYPADHPYGSPILGTKESIEATSRSDLEAVYRSFFTASHVTIAVAGDISRSAIGAALEARFGAQALGSSSPAPTPPIPAIEVAAPGPRLVLIDDPGAVHSTVALSGIGPTRRAADHLPMLVLGRLLSSRLWANLRQGRGYTYGTTASFSARREAGPFVAGNDVVREETPRAVTELLAELESLREKEVSAARFDDLRRLMLNSAASAFETTDGTAAALLDLATYHLPLDEYATLGGRLKALTPADLLRVARARLDPEKLRLFVVGDASVIGGGLAKLGFGAPSIRSIHPRSGDRSEGADDTSSVRLK